MKINSKGNSTKNLPQNTLSKLNKPWTPTTPLIVRTFTDKWDQILKIVELSELRFKSRTLNTPAIRSDFSRDDYNDRRSAID